MLLASLITKPQWQYDFVEALKCSFCNTILAINKSKIDSTGKILYRTHAFVFLLYLDNNFLISTLYK